MAQILTREIYWRRNSPYGTFVATDLVSIYYDNSLGTIVVKKNGTVITSGNSIPQFFQYNGSPATYYKTETAYDVVICSSTTKITLDRDISAFPYVSKKQFANSPSCAVAPVVCDLAINSLPVVVNETTQGSSDGSITVLATSSNGAIEYKNGSDFIYGDGTGQSSGLFSGLTSGNYRIFSRDAANCSASISVNVSYDKVYGTRYELTYYDRLNAHTKIEILERDYVGSSTDLVCGEVPILIRQRGEGEEDKFVPILGCEIELALVSQTDYQYQTLFTSDPAKYRIRYSKDFGSGYQTLLTTKILPNQYKEAYVDPPYPVAFLSTDGLALLKDIPFLDAGGNRFYGTYRCLDLISYCLRNTGLNLNIRIVASIYAETMDNDPTTDDPFEQAYVDTDAYYFDETPSCLDILQYILSSFGAQVVQWGDAWNITRVEEKVDVYTYRDYDFSGVFISSGTVDPVLLSGSTIQSGVIWVKDPEMEMNNAYGSIKVKYKLGLRDNLLRNGDFKLKTENYSGFNLQVPDTTAFQIVANGDDGVNVQYQIVEQDKVKPYADYSGVTADKNNIAIIMGQAFGNAYLLAKTINVKLGNSDSLKFTIRCGLPIYKEQYPYVKVRVVITYGNYYLTGDGTWSLVANEITYFVTEYGKYVEFSTTSISVPTGAAAGLDLKVKVYHAYVLDSTVSTVAAQRAIPTGPSGTITAGSFVVGHSYTILTLGTTNFTLIGAASNTIGVSFTATGAGSGTGTATAIALGLGYRIEREDLAAFKFYYYELENNTSAESVPNIVRPTDYNAVTNPVQWILKTTRGTPIAGYNQFFIDKVQLQYFFNGALPPTIHDADIQGEQNNPYILKKEIVHGSLVEAVQTNTLIVPIFSFNPAQFAEIQYVDVTIQNTALTYCGYLRDSAGVGYENWARTYADELANLHDIMLSSYAAQYNTTWRRLRGALAGIDFVTPLNSIKETLDGDRIYYPIALEIDDINRVFSGEYVELADVVTSDAVGSFGFTTGFSIGFNA
jgi:hypothetical protein